MYKVSQCPICSASDFNEFLACKDFTVSHETFEIIECKVCSFKFTSPRPDDSELGKYYISDSYISHSNSSKSLSDKLYKISREFTLNWKFTLVKKKISDNGKLLDYGCGTGHFLNYCADKKIETFGVEPSDPARKIAGKNSNAAIKKDLSEVSGKFDVITLWHVLEHVSDLNEKISELKSLLQKNGTMFIAVPNHKSADAKKYASYWAGYDVPRHLWHFDQTTMKQLLEKHGMTITETIPMKLDAYYVSMLSDRYKNGSSFLNLVKGVMNGFLSNLRAANKNYSSLIYVARVK